MCGWRASGFSGEAEVYQRFQRGAGDTDAGVGSSVVDAHLAVILDHGAA